MARVQAAGDHWLEFNDPVLILQADSPDAVRRTLADVEQLTRDRGLHAVGFVTYEAGAAFGLPVSAEISELPLAWFALCEPSGVLRVGRHQRTADYRIGTLTPSVDRMAFAGAFARIRHHLAEGNTYQANFTFRMDGSFEGDAASFFADLCDAQRGAHSAFIDLGRFAICSASPELFFEIQGLDVVARPMKGTVRRGRTARRRPGCRPANCATSSKNQAENVMVVDMVRNDLGRIADVGSVQVCAVVHGGALPERLADDVAGEGTIAGAACRNLRRAAPVGVGHRAHRRWRPWSCSGNSRPVRVASTPARWVTCRQTAWRRSTSPSERRSSTVPDSTLSFGIGSGIVWDSESDARV